MATTLNAILSIAAKVTGEGAVNAITGAVKKLENTSKTATGTLKGLAGSAGGLGGALGALAPVLSVAGLVGLATGSIKAASGMYDLSQRTGVSVEMLAKFKKAASTSGTDLDAVVGGLTKLSKAMAAAAADSGLGRKTKAEIDIATTAIKNGERDQTDAVKRAAAARIDALKDESDRRLSEISRRYRREEQILNDSWDDQADKEDKAAEKRLNAQVKAINREYDAKRKIVKDNQSISDSDREAQLQALQDAEDKAVDIVREGGAKQAKERQRAARDSQQITLDGLNAKRDAEEKIIKDAADKQAQIVKDGADKQVETFKKLAEEAIKALNVDPGANALEQQMEDLGLSGKAASAEFAKLGVSIQNQDGTLRAADAVLLDIANKFKGMTNPAEKTALALKLFGRSGAELVPLLSKGGDAIEELKVKMTGAFAEDAKKYTIELTKLNGKIGAIGGSIAIALLPAMQLLAKATGAIVDVFTKLPEPLQAIVGGFAVLAIGLTALAPLILAATTLVGGIAAAFSGSAIAATIAGWLGALGPVLTGLGTFAAAVVGWPLLIGAALVAIGVLLYSFRDQIGAFLGWIVKGAIDLVGKIGQALSGVAGFVNKIISGIVQFTVEYYKSLYALFVFYIIAPIKLAWDGLVTFLGEKLGQAANAIGQLWSVVSTAFTTYVITPIINAWNTYIGYLGKSLAPVVSAIGNAWTAISSGFTTYVSGPITKAWSSMVTFLGTALSNVAGGITRVWTGIVNGVKGALRGMVQFAANALNGVIGAIRAVIQGINKARAAVNMAPIGMPGFITVPAFAEGGVVNRPTLAMVGEAGPEYIIPASKMAAASTNYLAGSRGASVLNGGGGTMGTPQINITTGPVMQTSSGQQWVSIDDLERAQRQTIEAMMAQLRTPAGRYAMGVR